LKFYFFFVLEVIEGMKGVERIKLKYKPGVKRRPGRFSVKCPMRKGEVDVFDVCYSCPHWVGFTAMTEIMCRFQAELELYEITNEILRRVNDIDDELDGSVLDGLVDEFGKKVEGCAHVIRNLTAEAKALREEATNLVTKAAIAEVRVDWLKGYIKAEMERAGMDKVKAGLFDVSVRDNPPSVEVLDASAIPVEYVHETVYTTIDKKAIVAHLRETGEVVGGVRIVVGKHVRIR
jgi:hypothetical protein